MKKVDKLERYEPELDWDYGCGGSCCEPNAHVNMSPDKDGEWVKLADVKALLEEKNDVK